MTTASIPTTVTGYRLREALKQWEMSRDIALCQFDDTQYRSPRATVSETPVEYGAQALEAETAIAELQEAQAQYNLAVMVAPYANSTESMSLCMAIKLIGGIARLETKWRAYARTIERDHCGRERSIPLENIKNRVALMSAKQHALRSAIALGNAQVVVLNINPQVLK